MPFDHREFEPDVGGRSVEDPVVSVDATAVEDLHQELRILGIDEGEDAAFGDAERVQRDRLGVTEPAAALYGIEVDRDLEAVVPG